MLLPPPVKRVKRIRVRGYGTYRGTQSEALFGSDGGVYILAVTPPKFRAVPLEVRQNVDRLTATSRNFGHFPNKIGNYQSYRETAFFAKQGLRAVMDRVVWELLLHSHLSL